MIETASMHETIPTFKIDQTHSPGINSLNIIEQKVTIPMTKLFEKTRYVFAAAAFVAAVPFTASAQEACTIRRSSTQTGTRFRTRIHLKLARLCNCLARMEAFLAPVRRRTSSPVRKPSRPPDLAFRMPSNHRSRSSAATAGHPSWAKNSMVAECWCVWRQLR